MNKEKVSVLRLNLHGLTVGFLAGYQGGKNVLVFDPSFRDDHSRPTLSLTTHPNFPKSAQLLAKPWITQQRLHAVLSNMLPEGVQREYVAQTLKVHVDNEFPQFSYLGDDLPGALIATPLAPEEIPGFALQHRTFVEPVPIPPPVPGLRFSLAGVQNKFSMRQRDGHYFIPPAGQLGDWIIKPPSPRYPFVPLNEFSAMSLAKSAGVCRPKSTPTVCAASTDTGPSAPISKTLPKCSSATPTRNTGMPTTNRSARCFTNIPATPWRTHNNSLAACW